MSRSNYRERREYMRTYQRQWIANRRAAFFSDKHCIDCGSTNSLELDHRDPSTKIASAIWSWAEVRRVEEIAKCDIRCHGCHRKKTVANNEMAYGVRIGASKLNPDLVIEIRTKFAAGATKRGLAREYGVDEKGIRSLLKGETWKQVP